MVDIPFPLIGLDVLQLPFYISIASFVFCNYLTEDGEIFELWPSIVDRYTTNAEWLRKPLHLCAKCQAGSATLIISLLLGYYWQAPILAIIAIFLVLLWQKIIF